MQKSKVAWIQIYTWRYVPPTIKFSRWHHLGDTPRTGGYYAAVTPSSMIRIARVLPQLWIHSAKLLKGE